MKERIYVVNSLIDIKNNIISIISSCLYGFQNWYENNEIMLINMLEDIVLKNESTYFEMYGVILASDPEGFDEEFLKEFKNTKVIAVYFLDEYVVLNEKIAAQYIVDWCNEYATHPDIPALLEKIKLKYCINYSLAPTPSLFDNA